MKRAWSQKQIRYLWAIGFFRKSQGYNLTSKPNEVSDAVIPEIKKHLQNVKPGQKSDMYLASGARRFRVSKSLDGKVELIDSNGKVSKLSEVGGLLTLHGTQTITRQDFYRDLLSQNQKSPTQYGEASKVLSPMESLAPTEQEQVAVVKYRGSDYQPLNSGLRSDNLDPYYNRIRDGLDSLIDRSQPTSEILKVYRGVSGNFVNTLLNLHTSGQAIGSVIEEKGYSSTSTDEGVSKHFSLRGESRLSLEIDIPKGSKVLNIEGWEHEVLLPRNSHFEIYAVQSSDVGTVMSLRLKKR